MSKLSLRMRVLPILVTLVALAAQVVAPSVLTQAAGPKVLHYSLGGEPSAFDPQQANFTGDVAYTYAVWRSLLRYDPASKTAGVIPSIATDVPTKENGGISADGLTYTYHLRDWKWSDGKGVVTAQDFVYSYERLIDPAQASAYGGYLNGIVVNAQEIQDGKAKPTELGVKAVDDKTFAVTLVKPLTYFNQLAATWALAAVRKDNVERAGLPSPAAWTDPANGEVVGSGPFIIKSWDHSSKIVLVKNPNYSGTPAKLDSIEFTLQDDPAVQFAAYQAGDIDVSGLPIAQLEVIKADPVLGKDFLKYPILCTEYLAMDNTQAPFDNAKVREAFTYAFDRESWVNVIGKGVGKVAYSFIPPGMKAYDANAGKDREFNKEKAAQLLAAAGFPGGKGFPTVPFNYVAGANTQRRAEWIQAQLLSVLGVNIALNPMEGATYQQANSDPIKKLPGMQRLGWCADYPHPADWFGLVFKYGPNGNANNVEGFKDPEFDKAVDVADAELNDAKSDELYKAIGLTLIKDAPVVFLDNIEIPTLQRNSKITGMLSLPLDGGFPGSTNWEGIDLK